MGIFAAGQRNTAAKLNALANSNGMAGATGVGTTTSSSYANVAGSTSFSFTKIHASTVVRVSMTMTAFADANLTLLSLAALVNGTDYECARFMFNTPTLNAHQQAAGSVRISGLAAGTYPFQARWKRTSGAGTISTDANDWLTFDAIEVQAA